MIFVGILKLMTHHGVVTPPPSVSGRSDSSQLFQTVAYSFVFVLLGPSSKNAFQTGQNPSHSYRLPARVVTPNSKEDGDIESHNKENLRVPVNKSRHHSHRP